MYFKPEPNVGDTKSFQTKNIIQTIAGDQEVRYNDFSLEIVNKAENFREKVSGECQMNFFFVPH